MAAREGDAVSDDRYSPGAKCPDCGGTGTYLYENDAPAECPTCDGTGRIPPADDAPDIPPALTVEEWKERGRERQHLWVRAAGEKYTHLRIGGDPRNPYFAAGDASDVAAIIAVGNEVLRRMDDPRAILREHVKLLRDVAEIAHMDLAGTEDDRYAQLHGLADALESYLPPTESLTAETRD